MWFALQKLVSKLADAHNKRTFILFFLDLKSLFNLIYQQTAIFLNCKICRDVVTMKTLLSTEQHGAMCLQIISKKPLNFSLSYVKKPIVVRMCDEV